jgi:ATP phosphoribosyltransferase regulatory subunit
MRDWLPRQARRRAVVSERIMLELELFGYQRVEVPPFEYAEVLERGFGNADATVRFVEPETGKIAALRSDVTPQIARLVSTRFPEGPWPARLSYQASVMRRRRERARLDQKVLQVGFELCGQNEHAGDLEVLETATSALRATGLRDFTVDLAHAQVAGALLDQLAPKPRAEALESLAIKDGSELRRVAARGGLSGRNLEALAALPELHGADDVWPRAELALRGTLAEAPMRSLQRIWAAAKAADLAPHFVVDLGETREFYYYTGTMFHLLAEGPGEPLGSGGRYDTLFERFDLTCPAAGFAFDISNVCWALDEQGAAPERLHRVLVSASTEGDMVIALLRELRRRGVACASGPEPALAAAHADRWDYSHVLELQQAGARLLCTKSGKTLSLPLGNTAPGNTAARDTVATDITGRDTANASATSTSAGELAEAIATRLRVLEEV